MGDPISQPSSKVIVPEVVNQAPQENRSSSKGGKLTYGYSYAYTGGQREKPLTEYISVFVRFRYVIITCVLIGIAYGYRTHRNRPVLFESSSLVNVGTYVPPTDGPTAEAIKYEQSKGEYLQSLIPILKSNSIAKRVLITNPDIRSYIDPTFEISQGNADNKSKEEHGMKSDYDLSPEENISVGVLEAYLGHISTYNFDQTNLLSMTATSGSAEMSARMANAHAEAFMEIIRQQRFVWATTNVEFLKEQVATLKGKSEVADKALLEFSRKNAVFVLDNTRVGDVGQQKLDSLVSSLSQTVLERVTATEEARARRRAISSGGYVLNSQTNELISKLNLIKMERSKLSSSQVSQRYLNYLDAQIRSLEEQLRQLSMIELKDLSIRASAVGHKESLIREELNAQKKKEIDKARIQLEYSILEKEAKTLKENLQKVEARLEESMINARSDQKTVLLVDAAVAPEYPIMTKKVSTLLSGALFGLLLGIGLAFFLDFHNARVRTVSDLTKLTESPVLGVIPTFSKSLISLREINIAAMKLSFLDNGHSEDSETHIKELLDFNLNIGDPMLNAMDTLFMKSARSKAHTVSAGQSSNLILVAKPQCRESEAFRNLRATLKYSSRQGSPKLILVTSGQKGDGKTTVAVNLACSLAQTSARTVIIDADLRMPTVHTHFRRERGVNGLADYLSSKKPLEGSIYHTEVPELMLIPAGSAVSNPAELLGSRRFSDLLDRLADEYDHIIIDTPPVGEIADALLICRKVDGVLLVARSGVTPRAVANLAVTRLNQVRAKILGTALNGLSAIDGVGEGYNSYYYHNSYLNAKQS